MEQEKTGLSFPAAATVHRSAKPARLSDANTLAKKDMLGDSPADGAFGGSSGGDEVIRVILGEKYFFSAGRGP